METLTDSYKNSYEALKILVRFNINTLILFESNIWANSDMKFWHLSDAYALSGGLEA